ncbi:MAG: type II toxin-antitoxin system VapC family toxin [Phycisphaerales bacterium]|nr:type II toxin-antitoxin system VapC family toxin [Phycisphaerales bacterium]
MTKPPPIVAVDSMILAWSLREDGSEDQRSRTQWLFDQFEEEQCQIIVPTVVLAEFLVPLSEQRRTEMLGAMSGSFLLAPFDVRCAAIAASLIPSALDGRKKGEANSRHSVKVDAMLVATAKVWNAGRVYSNDTKCRELAQRLGLVSHDLPKQPSNLFGYTDKGVRKQQRRMRKPGRQRPKAK